MQTKVKVKIVQENVKEFVAYDVETGKEVFKRNKLCNLVGFCKSKGVEIVEKKVDKKERKSKNTIVEKVYVKKSDAKPGEFVKLFGLDYIAYMKANNTIGFKKC